MVWYCFLALRTSCHKFWNFSTCKSGFYYCFFFLSIFVFVYIPHTLLSENFANQAFHEIFLITQDFNFANQEKLCISPKFNFPNGQNRYLSFFLFRLLTRFYVLHTCRKYCIIKKH